MKLSIKIDEIDATKDQEVLIQLLAIFSGVDLEYVEGEDEEDEEDEADEDEEDEAEAEDEVEIEEDAETDETSTKTYTNAKRSHFVASQTQQTALGGKPFRLRLAGHEPIRVASWKDVLIETAEALIKLGHLNYINLPYRNSKFPLVSVARRGKRPLTQLSNGLFVDAGHCSRDLMKRALELYRLCTGKENGIEVDYVLS